MFTKVFKLIFQFLLVITLFLSVTLSSFAANANNINTGQSVQNRAVQDEEEISRQRQLKKRRQMMNQESAESEPSVQRGRAVRGIPGMNNGQESKRRRLKKEAISLKLAYFPYRKVKNGPAQISRRELNFKFMFPIFVRETRTILFNGLSYRYNNFAYKDEPTGYSDQVTKFHRINYHFTLIQMISKKWMLVLPMSVGLHSDMKNLKDYFQESVNLNGGVNVGRKFGNFTLFFGFFYTSAFGSPMLLPAIGFNWFVGKYFLIKLIPPREFSITYITSHIEIGLKIGLSGDQYRITESGVLEGYRLKYSLLLGGIDVKIRLYKAIYLTVFSGIDLWNRFEIFNNNGDEVGDRKTELSWFIKSGVAIRF